jgi:hypothetical protein
MQEADNSQEHLRVLQLQALLATLQVHPFYASTFGGASQLGFSSFPLQLTIKIPPQLVCEGLLPWNALV